MRRYETILVFVIAVVVILLLRRRSAPAQEAPEAGRDSIDVPGVGNIELATDEERDRWRDHYDRLAGVDDG